MEGKLTNFTVNNHEDEEKNDQKAVLVYKDTRPTEYEFRCNDKSENNRKIYHTTSLYKNKTPSQMYGSIKFDKRYSTLKYKTSGK